MGTGAEVAIYALYAAAVVGGTYATVEGQNQQAKSAQNIADYNAKVAENAAIQKDMEHRENVARIRKNNERLKATSETRIAKAGVIFEGSPLDVLGQNAAALDLMAQDEGRLGEAAIRSGQSSASASRFEGRSIAAGLRNKSVGTVISGFGQVASTGIQSGAFA